MVGSMFTKTQMKFFQKTAEVADTSCFDVYHVGCIAVLKNKIIALSPNKLKTHRLQAEFDKYRNFNCISDPKNMHSLHAEIACLSSIKKDINYKDLDVYIVRRLKSGGFGMARPCAACMPYIKSLGVRNIFYSTNYGFAHEELY